LLKPTPKNFDDTLPGFSGATGGGGGGGGGAVAISSRPALAVRRTSYP